MLNSVGLRAPASRPGSTARRCPPAATGARIVASVWGRTVDEYAAARGGCWPTHPTPWWPSRSTCRARTCGARACSPSRPTPPARPWRGHGRVRAGRAGPSSRPTVADLAEIAAAARDGGADAVTLVNTMPGWPSTRRRRAARLGAGGGGLSGPALHPVAVKRCTTCTPPCPSLPIVGVGGVAAGGRRRRAAAAGATAVQVGTATFADPRAPWQVLTQLERLVPSARCGAGRRAWSATAHRRGSEAGR